MKNEPGRIWPGSFSHIGFLFLLAFLAFDDGQVWGVAAMHRAGWTLR